RPRKHDHGLRSLSTARRGPARPDPGRPSRKPRPHKQAVKESRMSTEATTESAGDFLARMGTDGSKWAAEFRQTAIKLGYSDMDEGWLIGWFANAIEAGADRSR